MESILECKHESAEVIHTIMGRAYISRCTSHCGQIFLEDEYNDSHVILSPDWNVVEQRDQLAAQVEALALENQKMKAILRGIAQMSSDDIAQGTTGNFTHQIEADAKHALKEPAN